ncbi:RING finger domain-containing protein [Diplocarpon rosae]|nr:RING finger domain-containing protein [Diplocarpon rosae]
MPIPYETRSSRSWPETTVDVREDHQRDTPGAFTDEDQEDDAETSYEDVEEHTPSTPPQKHYAPRTCRICLEEVLPTLELPPGGIPSILHPAPKVVFISSDSTSGRLIRPCKCRGSQQYVHEGCLQEWRHSDPSHARRIYWECPTCKYQYRLERMRWSRVITSTFTQIMITFGIMIATVFVFGFIADPIINLYLDPYDTITSLPSGGAAMLLEDEDASWIEHFLKGLASLGLLGFVKVFFAMSPWHWWNMRNSGLLGGGGRRRGGTGRERLSDISWTIVVIGVIAFLAAVWTWVRAWTAKTLNAVGDRVVDVQGEDEPEELAEPTAAAAEARSDTTTSDSKSRKDL